MVRCPKHHLTERGIFTVMHLIASETVYPKVHSLIVRKRFVWEREKPRKDVETELIDLAEKACLDKARELGVNENDIVIQNIEKGDQIDERIRGSDLTFLVNPLSGAYNAANHIPFFAFSIAAISNRGEVLSALVKDLTTGCTFHAMKGGGAWLNGEILQVSQNDHGSAIALAQPSSKDDLRKYLSLSLKEPHVRFLGSPVLEICLVALDSLCAYVDISKPPTTTLPEVAAGKLILEEAGGIATDTNGKPFSSLFGCSNVMNVIAARNRATHESILDQVRYLKDKFSTHTKRL